MIGASILLAGLYCLIMTGNPLPGALFVLCIWESFSLVPKEIKYSPFLCMMFF